MASRGWGRGLGLALALVWALLLPRPIASEVLPPGPDEVLAADPAPSAPSGDVPAEVAPDRTRPVFGAVSPAEKLRRAWEDRGLGFETRVDRLRDASLALGILDVDAAARALLLDESLGDRRERTAAAVLLAPGLPDAHAAHAVSRLIDDRDPGGALASLRVGFRSLPRNLEASVWMRATAADALVRGLLACGLLFLFVAAGTTAPRAVRWIADRWQMPAVSAAAGLAAALLLPAALGEGLFGIAVACGAFAMAWGRLEQRLVCTTALAAVVLALHPLAAWRDAEAAVLLDAPVAASVHHAERTLANPLDLARLEFAASSDRLAARALAVHAKRSGEIRRADAEFRELLVNEEGVETEIPELLANAANVRLALGETEEASELYERAAQMSPTPLLLFNLSQVYGRAIRLEEQDLALAEAQTFDAEAVRSLISLVASHEGVGIVDLPVPPVSVRARATRVGSRGVPELRARYAPGFAGGSFAGAGFGLGLSVAAGAWFGRGLRARRSGGNDSVTRREGSTDPTARMARLEARRIRQRRLDRVRAWIAAIVPGACALQKGRPLLGFLAVAAAVAAFVCFGARSGVVPDVFAVGALGGLTFGVGTLLAVLGYGVFTVLSYLIEEASEACP